MVKLKIYLKAERRVERIGAQFPAAADLTASTALVHGG